MKNRCFIALVFMLIYKLSFACDLCTIYLGIQPNDFKNSFSVRHRYRLFERDFTKNSMLSFTPSGQRSIKGEINNKHNGAAPSNLLDGETYRYTEKYNSYDVAVNFFLSTKFQLNGSINFSDNYVIQNDSIIDNIGGIGDFNLILKYQIFNSIKKKDTVKSQKIIHRLNLGAGITLPTGNYNKYSVVDFNTTFTPNTIIGEPVMDLDPHLQPGTGAYGYLVILEYLIRSGDFGFNSNYSYKWNSTNKNGFQFADRFNANGTFFMLSKLSKKVSTMPKLGLSYEYSLHDQSNNEPFIDSGGEVLFLNYGLNLFINKLGLEFTYYNPIKEYLSGNQPFNKRRIISQITYYF